ncbi:MAG: response regulator [Leptospiraceae bacterium]|jgi:two-component system chemotaxis response regulator CheY|nr:response regulator [Leptospiraceae bacterium]MCZ8345744.1 response regulator [Leptospiraceae bacterium]PJE01497.1 MAG: two-component system response regulator [Leptospira sp.]
MGKGFIICVDDEVSVLETLTEQLRSRFGSSHEIEAASSAEDALALIDEIHGSQEVVELIISDQVMPGMKGDEFLQEVHKKIPDAIKIMLTGQAGLDSAINAINTAGLSRYVEKPWNIEEFANDIKILLDKFHANLENQRLIASLNQRIAELEKGNS